MKSTHLVSGAELTWRRAGHGPVIVWCHGLGSSTTGQESAGLFDWSALESDYTLLRYDARGHGSSTGQASPADYRWDNLADDLLSLLDAVAPSEPIIGLGSSMGSATLVYAALHDPSRFSNLVLTSPSTAYASRANQALIYRRLAAVHERSGKTAFDRERMSAPRPAIFDSPGHPQVEWEVSPELTSAVLEGAALSDLPPLEQLRTITVPTLILGWSTDPAHPIDSARTLAKTLPHATLTVAHTVESIRTWPSLANKYVRVRSHRPELAPR